MNWALDLFQQDSQFSLAYAEAKFILGLMYNTAQNVSVFGFFLVRIFLDWDWMRRDTPYLFRIQSECLKIRTRKTAYTNTVHAVQVMIQMESWYLNSIKEKMIKVLGNLINERENTERLLELKNRIKY